MTDSHNPQDQTQAEIRRIIENYKEYVTGVYQGTEDYDEDVVIAAIDSYANQRALEARIDEMEKFIDFESGENGRLATLRAKRLNLTKGGE